MSRPDTPRGPNRGEIWLLDWSPGRGPEQTGRRPALIVQGDPGNHSPVYPNTIIAGISSRGRSIPFHVFVRRSQANGLKVDSYVKCEQVQTVSKMRLLGTPWGQLTEAEMAQVDAALKLSLGLG